MRHKALSTGAVALALAAVGLLEPGRTVLAQAARGAPAAFERVRDVMTGRFRDEKLSGDPDHDFATLLIATSEELVFLSKTQLEYGGDRQLREVAQRIQDDQQKQIDALKEWQVRSRQAGYKAQPDQPAPGTGPLDLKGAGAQAAVTAPAAPAQPAEAPRQQAPAASAPPPASSNAPLVSGTVKKVDTATGKVTLDHARIPNIDMDAMTMAYKVRSPALLQGVRAGDKVRFSAEDVDGQTMITRIQPAR
jgi:Cu/Ag efflux protein CusF